MVKDYPREPLVQAVGTAAEYGMFDLDRLEGMILRRIRSDYFLLGNRDDPDSDGGQGDDHDR